MLYINYSLQGCAKVINAAMAMVDMVTEVVAMVAQATVMVDPELALALVVPDTVLEDTEMVVGAMVALE